MKQTTKTKEPLKQNIYISEDCPSVQTGKEILKKAGLNPNHYYLYMRSGLDLIFQQESEIHVYQLNTRLVAIHNSIIL